MGKLLAFPNHANRNALVVEHLDLVAPIARYIKTKLPPSFDIDDLISAGNLGLIDAASKWRADRGVPFEAYARFRIKGEILSSVRRHQWENSTMGGLEPWHSEIADPSSEPGAMLRQQQLRTLLESALELLPEREQTVIKTKYFSRSDLNGAARKLKLCPSRASQLHCKGLKSLKKSFRLRDLDRVA